MVKQALANSADPDKTAPKAAVLMSLHCLPFLQKFYVIPPRNPTDLLKFYKKYAKELCHTMIATYPAILRHNIA